MNGLTLVALNATDPKIESAINGIPLRNMSVEESWNITPAVVGNAPVCRFMPGISRSEGLFVAVLRKHGESETTALNASAANSKPKKDRKNQRKQTAQGGKQQSTDTMQALRTPDNFTDRRACSQNRMKYTTSLKKALDRTLS